MLPPCSNISDIYSHPSNIQYIYIYIDGWDRFRSRHEQIYSVEEGGGMDEGGERGNHKLPKYADRISTIII
jgi:hypothetical protein